MSSSGEAGLGLRDLVPATRKDRPHVNRFCSRRTSRQLDSRQRWLALFVLCAGTLMIVLDTTIVNVALPSIRADLGFSETSLAWVVNAYLLTFGGFLLLGGTAR